MEIVHIQVRVGYVEITAVDNRFLFSQTVEIPTDEWVPAMVEIKDLYK